jgi:hypothetical protein
MQQVDPFIPVSRKHNVPQGQYGNQWLHKNATAVTPAHSQPVAHTPQPPQPKVAPRRPPAVQPTITVPARPRRIDDFVRPKALQAPAPTQSTPRPIVPSAPKPAPPRAAVSGKRLPRRLQVRPLFRDLHRTLLARHRLLQKFQLPLFIVGAVLVGLLVQSLVFGEIVIGFYAAWALVRRIASRTTFMLALIALVGIVVVLLLQGESSLSNNFAVYAFLLLTIGTVSLGLEVRREVA